ncbi:MAG: glycosidase [Bacteroidales bacterium]
MERHEFDREIKRLYKKHNELVIRNNRATKRGNGIYERYIYPAITRQHIPIHWKYDLDYRTNPELLMRLGVNTTFNAGAIKLNNKYYMVVRAEGYDSKSFFAVAESPNGLDNWVFHDLPVNMPVTDDEEINMYDMRLTEHEDGWIYGLFCVERKDRSKPDDYPAAVTSCGIARTKDLEKWERLADLRSKAAQQKNCVLHPEFVDGKYMVYTRPQTGFRDTGDSGISVGFTGSMENALIDKEILVDPRQDNTVKEVKNGQGPPPIKTEAGWIHLAYGVRKTAAGLRYTLYLLLTDINEPWKVIKRPSGHFLEPLDEERVGDVSNVVFSNGWIKDDDGAVFIYYASSDTRVHVATTSVDKLVDYITNTPEDPGRSDLCVKQRTEMIRNNLEILKKKFTDLLDS